MEYKDLTKGMLVTFLPGGTDRDYAHKKRELAIVKFWDENYVWVRALATNTVKATFLSRLEVGDKTFPCRKEWRGGSQFRCENVCKTCKQDKIEMQKPSYRKINMETKSKIVEKKQEDRERPIKRDYLDKIIKRKENSKVRKIRKIKDK